jgi:hypothetical protein
MWLLQVKGDRLFVFSNGLALKLPGVLLFCCWQPFPSLRRMRPGNPQACDKKGIGDQGRAHPQEPGTAIKFASDLAGRVAQERSGLARRESLLSAASPAKTELSAAPADPEKTFQLTTRFALRPIRIGGLA